MTVWLYHSLTTVVANGRLEEGIGQVVTQVLLKTPRYGIYKRQMFEEYGGYACSAQKCVRQVIEFIQVNRRKLQLENYVLEREIGVVYLYVLIASRCLNISCLDEFQMPTGKDSGNMANSSYGWTVKRDNFQSPTVRELQGAWNLEKQHRKKSLAILDVFWEMWWGMRKAEKKPDIWQEFFLSA